MKFEELEKQVFDLTNDVELLKRVVLQLNSTRKIDDREFKRLLP